MTAVPNVESSDPAFESISLPEINALEVSGICPRCRGGLDSGAGFGRRDLECSECDFFLSCPLEVYFDQAVHRAQTRKDAT